jgi:protein-L-isoaspartate(D-aspartate) O-methyltransferase
MSPRLALATLVLPLVTLLPGCAAGVAVESVTASEGVQAADRFTAERQRMVRQQIEARGVKDARVLEAMRRVPRHRFVPDGMQALAYEDHPLPIGHDQTISQPFIVAWMTEALAATPQSRVLEIGTGSGYQAAVLGEIAAEVYTIEIVEPLARRSRVVLAELGYRTVHVRHGDGYKGWPDKAPFDAIMVTAAPEEVPPPLIEQLAMGGRLVIPVGGRGMQQMTVITKTPAGLHREERMPVRFVPFTRDDGK